MIAVLAIVVPIVFTVISGLLGLSYRNLVRRVRDLEEGTETRQGKHNGLADKVETIWKYLFGVPDDETDAGLSGEISEGFNNIEEDIEETQRKQETYHEVEMDQLERLVTELHHADSLEDLKREDLEEDD